MSRLLRISAESGRRKGLVCFSSPIVAGTVGAWRADAAILFGVTSYDPSIGVTAGFTYVFNAFKVP